MTPLPGQYEYCPGSDAISWAIQVLLLRGAVTADNSEAAPLKVGLLGLQSVIYSGYRCYSGYSGYSGYKCYSVIVVIVDMVVIVVIVVIDVIVL